MPLLHAFGSSSAGRWLSRKRNPIVVFSEATGPNTAATGGWYYQHGDGGWGTAGTASNYIYTYAQWWSSFNYVTNNNIDTTGAKSVTITFQGSSDNQYGYAWINFPGGGLTLIYPGQYSLGKQEITIPLDAGSPGGVGKIYFGAANTRQYNYLYGFTINF